MRPTILALNRAANRHTQHKQNLIPTIMLILPVSSTMSQVHLNMTKSMAV